MLDILCASSDIFFTFSVLLYAPGGWPLWNTSSKLSSPLASCWIWPVGGLVGDDECMGGKSVDFPASYPIELCLFTYGHTFCQGWFLSHTERPYLGSSSNSDNSSLLLLALWMCHHFPAGSLTVETALIFLFLLLLITTNTESPYSSLLWDPSVEIKISL